MIRRLSFAVLLSLASCGSAHEGDPACSVANCQALHMCGFVMAGWPDLHGCPDTTDAGADHDDLATYCPAVCNKSHAGPILACLAAPATSCKLSACEEPGPGGNEACSLECSMKRRACDDTCSTSSRQTCVDCRVRCGLALVDCLGACPAADARRP
jgi:hypothetical protein